MVILSRVQQLFCGMQVKDAEKERMKAAEKEARRAEKAEARERKAKHKERRCASHTPAAHQCSQPCCTACVTVLALCSQFCLQSRLLMAIFSADHHVVDVCCALQGQ